MPWFRYVLMGLGLVGMLWANRQYKAKGVAWGRPLAALFGIIALISAISAIFSQMGSNTAITKELMDKERKFQYVAYKKFGEKVGSMFPKANILLIREHTPPQVIQAGKSKETISFVDLREQAFREGLGSSGKIVAVEYVRRGYDIYIEDMGGTPNTPPQPPDLKKYEREMFIAKNFDEIIERNNDCNVIVSFVGLPDDFKEMKFWKAKSEKRPVLVLAETYVYELKPLIKAGLCPLILQSKPIKVDFEKMKMPNNESEIFDTRFFFITKDNVEQIAKENPKMFHQE